MARSRNHCCSENANDAFLVCCSATRHYRQYSTTKCCTKMFLWRTMSTVMIKRAYVFKLSARYFCAILAKFGVTRQLSIKVPNIMFQGKTVQWELR
jgi:hypothetical protein